MTSFGSEFKFAQLVNEFLKELEDDVAAPGQSKFQDYMPKCRKGMQAMEDVRAGVVFVLVLSCERAARIGSKEY